MEIVVEDEGSTVAGRQGVPQAGTRHSLVASRAGVANEEGRRIR